MENSHLNTSENATMVVQVPLIKTAHDILLVILLVAVMFAMGCHITWEQLWLHVRRPIGIVIGMCSQFVLLPLSAFCLIKVLKLGILHATGLLLLACSPGGVTSNIFTYFCDGDISLSIAMTTCSTLVALGMMPLNLYMYGQNLNREDVVIPYGKMALSLVAVTCPVLVGMLVHWKWPKLAGYLTKIGSYAGLLIIVVCQTMEFFIFPNIFANVPWQLYFAVVILPCLGFSLGYVSGWVCRQKPQVRRTISIESGVQNVGTALTVASLSFPFENLEKVLLFPWLYAFSMTGVCIIISALYQLYVRQCNMSKSVETLPVEREVSAVRYAEEGGKSNSAYVGDSTKM
ncbi:ileal sodium/bile acid cotransporter-like [Argiope bruennichi]|uniref:Ileal sodium/bile acid cotransporter like protein n=1 Tax=Argiope bruennichi TaxID=94029 RepID=A0A8T0F4G9_ARGBR|nr:ileal sodium/bile acid cotransporter-like [Argiope bruennichi]KAF8785178.1 Ileal sodium/bile acid cotransporter like protein [Argiope bruennichi]